MSFFIKREDIFALIVPYGKKILDFVENSSKKRVKNLSIKL